MNETTVKKAEREAVRFLKAVEAWRQRRKDCPEIYTTKEGGALHRASLDLTRALTKMRKR